MKIYLSILIVWGFAAHGNAQKTRTLYYSSQWELTTQDSAQYYRVCKIDTVLNKFIGEVNDFTMQGQLLMKVVYERGLRNGLFTSYYPSGQIESQGKFFRNARSGEWNYFYPDGRPLRTVTFAENSYTDTDFFVQEAYDSNGKSFIKDGTGEWTYTYEEYGFPYEITVKGTFVKGKKENNWICIFSNGETHYKETFKNGKFKSGYFTNPDGSKKEDYKIEFQNKFLSHYRFEATEKFYRRKQINQNDYPFLSFLRPPNNAKTGSTDSGEKVFVVVEQPPEYDGGLEAMYNFITKNLQYPAHDRKMKIEGSVFITFTVEVDGSITNALITKGISASCDQEALRIVKMMPKWRPGKQQGKPVRVKFVLPIKFKLGR
jgi:TonB family protein